MSATSIRLDATPTIPAPAGGSHGSHTGAPDEPYTVRVVNMAGTPLGSDLELAAPGDITEPLNAPMEFEVHFPKRAYSRSDIDILGRSGSPHEVQVLLGEKVLAWGPAITPDGGSDVGDVKLTCAGVDWYFPKRNVDAEPVNLLPNPGFEDDLTGWTTQAGVTATIETDLVLEGTKALRLTSSTDNPLGVISDAFHYTSGRTVEELTFTVSFVLEEFLGPALLEGGIIVEASKPGSGGAVVGGVNAISTALYKIDATTPRGVVIRPTLTIRIPARTTWAISVNLFGVKGSIVWDAGYFVADRSITTDGLDGPVGFVDVARIVRLLANNTLTNANNKSDLHIALELPGTGVKLSRTYLFSDHTALDQALAEFLDRTDCFDYAIRYTKTTRTLVLYPIASGPGPLAGKGTDRSGTVTLAYGSAPVAGYAPGIDGGSTVTQAAELGDGSGGSREERWATDATPIGGTVLQEVNQAPPGTPLDSLGPLAAGVVAQQSAPPETIDVTIDREPVIIGGDPVVLQDLLEVGDIITLAIADGWWTFDGTWRIVQRVRHCLARTMTYTLNKIAL